MPSGRLGAANLAATTNTTVYTVPAARVGTFSVSICNRNSVAVTIRMAIAATGTPTLAEFIEFDSLIPANGVLERSALVADAGRNLVVFSSAANVSAVAYGFEE